MPFRVSHPPRAEGELKNPVVLRTFLALHEAEIARAQLEANEIASRVEDSATAGVHPLLGSALGGVRLMVSFEDEGRAREVLDAIASDVAAAEAARSDDERRTDEADAAARRAMAAAGLGLLLLPVVAQLYSLYLLLGIDRARLSDAGRRRARVALAVDVVVLATAVWALTR